MYRFLKHTADVMFEVEARNLDELFSDAAKALMSVMVDIKDVKKKKKQQLHLEANDISGLMYSFLSELVYIKDRDYMLFSDFKVKVNENKVYELDAMIYGEKINSEKHRLGVDVKAVTMHDFIVEKRRDKWYAKVLLDV